MAKAREFPFRGWVIWPTREQGGRETGPPAPRPYGLTTWQLHTFRRTLLTPAWPHLCCGTSTQEHANLAPKVSGCSLTPRQIS
jgi:hypothetical protein